MSYGSPEWQGWVLNEEESLKHIKYAYDHGINAFDTANVYVSELDSLFHINLKSFIGTPTVSARRSWARRSSNST